MLPGSCWLVMLQTELNVTCFLRAMLSVRVQVKRAMVLLSLFSVVGQSYWEGAHQTILQPDCTVILTLNVVVHWLDGSIPSASFFFISLIQTTRGLWGSLRVFVGLHGCNINWPSIWTHPAQAISPSPAFNQLLLVLKQAYNSNSSTSFAVTLLKAAIIMQSLI